MLRIFICPNCYNLRMVSRKTDAICFHCGSTLVKCDVNYDTYMNMTEEDRNNLKDKFKLRMTLYHNNIVKCLDEKKM